MLGVERDRVRVIYLDGAGSYGPNGADDAAAEAALLSRAVGRPVRVQWSRAGGARARSEGPRPAPRAARRRRRGWRRSPRGRRRRGCPSPPPISRTSRCWPLDAAGIPQTPGRSTGLIYQNVDPPYAVPNLNAVVHWVPDAPLRTSPLRAPGKIANTFAVESFTDEIAALARVDPLEFRLRRLSNPRGIEVLQRVAARMGWQPRPSPRPVDRRAAVLTGRGHRLRALQARGDDRGDGHGGGGGARHRPHPRDPGGVRPGLRAHDQPGLRAGPARGQYPPDALARAARGGRLRSRPGHHGGLGAPTRSSPSRRCPSSSSS